MSANGETGTKTPLNIVAAVGLALGGLLGMLGTVVAARNLQSAFWAIDGVGVVVATALLAINLFRKGNDVVAAGFLVFTIGESVMLAGTATTLAGSVPSFAAGTALWSAGLLLTSVPREFAGWVRGGGADRINSFRDYLGKNILGSTGFANLLSAALFRLPLPCPYVHRLDLDTAEISLSRVADFVPFKVCGS